MTSEEAMVISMRRCQEADTEKRREERDEDGRFRKKGAFVINFVINVSCPPIPQNVTHPSLSASTSWTTNLSVI